MKGLQRALRRGGPEDEGQRQEGLEEIKCGRRCGGRTAQESGFLAEAR